MSLTTVGQQTRYPKASPERSNVPLPDGQLLERYVVTRDETAFAALVERYGSLVFGVCQRVLHHAHDAEDAFQATFLVLARRASSLDGRGPLGNWLYAVAHRTAVKARQNAARRRARELQVLNMPSTLSNAEEEWSDLRPLLDEELNQLPGKYRAPLVLCYLEGKTQEQAARELGWPTGSMSRRMNRARDLLQKRLARRGLALSTGFLFMLIAKNAGAAVVSPALVNLTARAASIFTAGSAGLAGTISEQVASLAREVLKTTPLASGRVAKIAITTALLILITLMTGILTIEILGSLHQGPLWGCDASSKADPGK